MQNFAHLKKYFFRLKSYFNTRKNCYRDNVIHIHFCFYYTWKKHICTKQGLVYTT